MKASMNYAITLTDAEASRLRYLMARMKLDRSQVIARLIDKAFQESDL